MSKFSPTSNPEAAALPKEQPTTQSHKMTDSEARHQRLMELVEAEDASNGEVGCGGDWGEQLPIYLRTCDINISDEKLRILLREHLGNLLMERDFDSILTQVSRFIESVAVQAHIQPKPPQLSPIVTEHIPTAELKQSFQSELGEFCDDTNIEQIVQFTHQVIHKAVLHPRYTWSKPIWVLRGEEKIYIAQAPGLQEAIAKVRNQNPEEIGELKVVKVGGLLAPDQVISLEKTGKNLLFTFE